MPRSCGRFAGLMTVLLTLIPSPAGAWGFEPHKYITERAIALLPVEIRPFFERYRVFLVEHSIDPDLWRNVGFTQEPPNHFLDIDAYGPYPFTELPRDYDAAVRKFGVERVQAEGLLPWRTADMYAKLVKSFELVKQGTAPFALDDVKLFSAVLAHYVADAHQPFHAIKNYDGQLTNQIGIHARFETDLFRRYRQTLVFHPRPIVPVRDARDVLFDTVVESTTFVPAILQADKDAVAGRSEYDDGYFDRFFRKVRPTLERRMAEAMTGVASIIAGAWVQAGRPALPLTGPRMPNRKVRVSGPVAREDPPSPWHPACSLLARRTSCFGPS